MFQAQRRDPVRLTREQLEANIVMRVEPEYPQAARRARVSGTVTLDVTVSEDGSVIRVDLIDGPAVFNRTAVLTVSGWEFRPTIVDGESVRAIGEVRLEFAPPADSQEQ